MTLQLAQQEWVWREIAFTGGAGAEDSHTVCVFPIP